MRRLVLCAAAVGVAGLSLLVSASASAAPPALPLTAEFTGVFTYHDCAVASDFCLTDRLTGEVPGVGTVTGTFEVTISFGRTDANGCAPISKVGRFTGPGGRAASVRADGFYCKNIADYSYVVTGAAGRGSRGLWLVPPPDTTTATGGSGAEYLSPTTN